ncbi:unnamed protein product [Pylaiella littoralis]
MSALASLFEGGGSMLQNVFDSMSAADKVDGGGGGRRQGEAGAGGAGGGSRLRPQSLGSQPQVYADPLHGPAASPKKNSTTCMRSAIATTTAAEEEGGLPDLPDLGRLERMDTPNMLMANRECSGSSNSNSSSPPSGEVAGRKSRNDGSIGAIGGNKQHGPVEGVPSATRRTPEDDGAQRSSSVSRSSSGLSAPVVVAPAGCTIDTAGSSATAGRWGRVGGIPTSSASTLVPEMSPAVSPGAGRGAGFQFCVSSRINNDTDDNNNDDDDDNASNIRNIPAPLDLSAIPAAAPPTINRSGGKFGSSAGSSASKPVVLQGAALESLERLGRPGSSVSDRSYRSKGSSSARGAGMTVPLGLAVPMEVHLGSAVSSVCSSNRSRQRNQLASTINAGKDFYSTGSVIIEVADLESNDVAGWGWAKSGSGVSSRGKERAGGPVGLRAEVVRRMFEEEEGESSDEVPPPPSPMLTGHLRRGPQDAQKQPRRQTQPKQQQQQQQPADQQQSAAGRGRAFKGRGVRPQTWNEENGSGAPPPGGAGSVVQDGQQMGRANNPPSGSEVLQPQQQQHQQRRHQNQMRLVVRDPQAVAASHNTFLDQQVSPGALSMVSCSTARSFSLSQSTRGTSSDAKLNDGETLASVAADIARRGASADAELVVGLGRGAFEHISMSPSIPLRGNDLAGVSKVIHSQAVPNAPVREVPPLEKRRAAAAAAAVDAADAGCRDNDRKGSASSGTRRQKPCRGRNGKPHVLETQLPRSGQPDDSASASSASVGGYNGSGPSSDGSRMSAPSLTVAHAPGRVYRPMVVGAAVAAVSHQQKRSCSGAVARGTPATHRNGVHKQATCAADGDVDAPPFRLPSSIRLTSFGSVASPVASPGVDGDRGQYQHHQHRHHQPAGSAALSRSSSQDLGEDTSALARRPTTIDMLSTFGSLSQVQDGSQMSDLSDLSDSTITNRARRGAGGGGRSGARRNSHGGDRISQRRTRSSGSHGGGTRRFDSSSGLMTPEHDARSNSGRGWRRSASRSLPGGEVRVPEESADSSRPKETRAVGGGQPGHLRKDAATSATPGSLDDSATPAIGSFTDFGGKAQQQQQKQPRSSSVPAETKRRSRGRKKESSPSRSPQKSRGSSRGKVLSPAPSTASKRRPRSVGRNTGDGTTTASGKHHRRRSSDVHGSIAANADGKGNGDSSSSNGGRMAEPSPQEKRNSRGRRSRQDQGGVAGAALASPKKEAGTRATNGLAGTATETATPSSTGQKLAAKGDPNRDGTTPPTVVNVTPASPAPDAGGKDGRRRSLRASTKPSIVPSNPGARKTRAFKKRDVRQYFAIASLFRTRKNSQSRSDCSDSEGSSIDGDGDEATAAAVAVGAAGRRRCVSFRGLTRSESLELKNAGRRSPRGGRFAGWLWRKITLQQLSRRRSRKRGGSSSSSSSGGSSGGRRADDGGDSPLPAVVRDENWHSTSEATEAAATATATAMAKPRRVKAKGGKSEQQQPPSGTSRARWSNRRIIRNNSSSNSQERNHSHSCSVGSACSGGCGAGGCGAVIGGCITQFYDSNDVDGEDLLESSSRGGRAGGAAHQKALTAEESADGQARVQQLLRTSQVHMNKHSSLRSASLAAEMSSRPMVVPH